MAVFDTDTVDYVYLDDETQTPVLVVSDPLSWHPPEDEDHLELLRCKLNAQIAFVETGQIKGVWPGYEGGLVRVEVVARHRLSGPAHDFYGVASRTMSRANMELSCRVLDS